MERRGKYARSATAAVALSQFHSRAFKILPGIECDFIEFFSELLFAGLSPAYILFTMETVHIIPRHNRK